MVLLLQVWLPVLNVTGAAVMRAHVRMCACVHVCKCTALTKWETEPGHACRTCSSRSAVTVQIRGTCV